MAPCIAWYVGVPPAGLWLSSCEPNVVLGSAAIDTFGVL